MLVRDILARNARIHPNRIALSSGGREITYRELFRRVRRYATMLRRLELGRGDRVAVLTHNSPIYVELLFAVTFMGCTLVPLNDLLIGREIKTILQDADVRALIYFGDFQDTIDGIRSDLPSVEYLIRIDPANPEALLAGIDEEAYVALDDLPLAEDDVVLQVYTSGAAGRPKGAMLSHRNLLSASASAALELGLSRNDIYLSCAPLPFIAGTGRLLRFMYMGGTVVLHREFDPEEVLASIERNRVTHVLFTPTMMAHILDLPAARRYNLSALQMVLYGGSSIPIDLLKRAIQFFGCRMTQSYGQVESSGILTFLHPEDHSLDAGAPYMRKLMSVGKEAIGVEVRVVDEEGREIAPNQVGEIIARGPNIFEGYYKDPSFTSEVVRGGWLHTGDVASVDEEGYIYIVDRKRDVLMTGGISVDPREIENILAEYPDVKEAAVIGRPDYTWGEVPVAVVALKEGRTADRDGLMAFCRANMAAYKVPRQIEFLPALPRNSQGKVLKVRLKERVAGIRKI